MHESNKLVVKMRCLRQCSAIHLIAFVTGICLLVILIGIGNSPSRTLLNEELESCTACSENGWFELQQTVPVPMEQIVSGMPIVLPQNDKRLIKYIWSNQYIHPPSANDYNIDRPDTDPSRGQGQFIRKLFNNMTNGFFVECGALDGETRSNSLFMEMHLGWKGLLVEGDPKNFELLQKKNRKAWAANNCLSVKPYPHTANFLQQFNTGKVLIPGERISKRVTYVKVQCMPLFSLLSAINVTTVDYFSLDAEGSELKVLKTIPFDKVDIRTLSVEYVHTPEGKKDLIKFMKSKDYRVVGEVHYPNNLANDIMFARKDVEFTNKP